MPILRTAAGSEPWSMAREEAACLIDPPVNLGSAPQRVMIFRIHPRRVSPLLDTALYTLCFGWVQHHTILMIEILGAVEICSYCASDRNFGSD